MSRRYVVVVSIGLGACTFLLARVIWPSPAGAPAPSPGLVPFLMVPAAFESFAFGAGVAFLFAAGRALARRGRPRWPAVATYASAGWLLVSWWPHSNMHRANTTLQGLAAIDWAFHITAIAAACVIAASVYRMVDRPASDGGEERPGAEAAGPGRRPDGLAGRDARP